MTAPDHELDTTRDGLSAPRRGTLKVYLGAVAGSGKTFAMLREGRDRRDNGEDVVIGFVETHGRRRTAEAIGSLEVVPRITVAHRGATLEEMDLEALIDRSPQMALVDELAHTNAPGVRHEKRWRDIEELCAAGIDVITTVNIQHLESVKDLVERITGITVHETVPDNVVDKAAEVQFIDITPEALRKRMQHGNVYPLNRVDTALANFFRPGNLAALREIGLRFVAERVDSERGGVQDPPEDVLVAVSHHRFAEQLIRRGARLARRRRGFCTVVHVRHGHQSSANRPWLELARELQCTVVDAQASDVATALITLARTSAVRHLVVGEPRATGALRALRPTIVDRLVERLPDVDIHVIAHYSSLRRVSGDRPDPEALLGNIAERSPGTGGLRLYLGYARGCGATTAMLDEARRRAGRGSDVLIAALSSECADPGRDFQILGGRRSPIERGILPVASLLARNPEVAAVDDLAGATDTGKTIAEVLPQLRLAGITVIGTVHLTDLRSTVETMGSLLRREVERPRIDDAVIDTADEIELVDIVPAELEERLRRGDIMPPTAAVVALQAEFRPDVLVALRETAFRRVAEHTDRRLVSYMRSARINQPWEARPRVLVCIPPLAGQDDSIRRAARRAALRDDALTAISVRGNRPTDQEKLLLGGYAALTHRLGGEFVTVYGDDVARSIAQYARDHRITEIIAVRSRRGRPSRTLRQLVRILADIDVHILAGSG